MKSFLFLLFLAPMMAHAQIIIHEDSLLPPSDLSGTHVQKIAGDSLVSTFVIFIKQSVPIHKHAHHSENVIVLEGEGIMTLGSITKEIRPGDIIFIPADTFHDVIVTSEIPLKVVSIQAPEFDGKDRILYLKN